MEKKTTGTAITKNFAKKMETISPFELKNKLIEMADERNSRHPAERWNSCPLRSLSQRKREGTRSQAAERDL